MQPRQQRTHQGRQPAWATRLFSLALSFFVILVGSATTSSAAFATQGSINTITLSTVYDGAYVPNDLDSNADNGVVASNDIVGFRWDLNATDLRDGIFVQTLPEGWAWDDESLAVLDSASTAYQSSYVLSDNNRTLTATISAGNGSGNPSVVGFATLKAIPSGDVANGSVYEPVLTATVGEDVRQATTDPVEVRNEPFAEVTKTRASNNELSEYDFLDGAGEVAARYIDFPITISNAATRIGARNIVLQQPLIIDDTFTLDAPEGYGDAEFVAEVVSVEPATGDVTLTQTGNSVRLAFDNFDSLPGATATVRFWVRNSEVPADSVGATKLLNTVTPSNWRDVNGDAVREDSEDNDAEGTVVKPPIGSGSVSSFKDIYGFRNQSGDSFEVTKDPRSESSRYHGLNGGEYSTGSRIIAWFGLHPGINQTTEIPNTLTNVVAYDFWNTAEQQIVDRADVYAGSRTTPLPASDYTVQYTAGTDSEDPENNTWVGSIAAAGGPESVSGVRVAYTAGAWGGGLVAEAQFLVGVQLTLVAPPGSSAQDRAVWTYTVEGGSNGKTARTQYVNIGDFRLALTKEADRSAIVSGSDIGYTLKPQVLRALGALTDVDVRGVTIVDTLPAGLVAVNTASVDPAWQVTRSGSAATGLELTFTYDGIVVTGQELPDITYSVTTSVQAPTTSQIVNTATLSALGSSQTAKTLTRSTETTIYQAEVISEEKVVVGDEQIEVHDPTVAWESRWFNFQNVSQAESHFVDVLPFNGDARGTSFTGTATLASALITNGAGVAAAAGYGSLEYTTDTAASVYAQDANSTAVQWIDATGVDFTTLEGVTALRVTVSDFASGADGIGGLLVTMNVEGNSAGDRYVNNVNGWLGVNGLLGLSNPAEITVIGSSIAGVVWHDVDGDGVRGLDEPLLGGVTVELRDALGTVITTVTTESDGSYLFDRLHSGEYSTTVDTTTLGFVASTSVQNSYDLDGDLDSDSGKIVLGKSQHIVDVDFGYVTQASSIELVKKTNGVHYDEAPGAKLQVNDAVEWTYEITNSGETPLTDLRLVDDQEGEIAAPVGFSGTLLPGESVTYRATGTAVPGQYHNVAIVSALTPSGADVNATDDSWYTAELPPQPPVPPIETPATPADTPAPPADVPADAPAPPNPPLVVTGSGQLAALLGAGAVLAATGLLVLLQRRRLRNS